MTPLSAGSTPREAVVEADNWLSALRAARAQLGEEGAVPPGASCVMAATGEVTILDAARRVRYALATTDETPLTLTTPRSKPASTEASVQTASKPQAAPKRRMATIAYSPEEARALREQANASAREGAGPQAADAQASAADKPAATSAASENEATSAKPAFSPSRPSSMPPPARAAGLPLDPRKPIPAKLPSPLPPAPSVAESAAAGVAESKPSATNAAASSSPGPSAANAAPSAVNAAASSSATQSALAPAASATAHAAETAASAPSAAAPQEAAATPAPTAAEATAPAASAAIPEAAQTRIDAPASSPAGHAEGSQTAPAGQAAAAEPRVEPGTGGPAQPGGHAMSADAAADTSAAAGSSAAQPGSARQAAVAAAGAAEPTAANGAFQPQARARRQTIAYSPEEAALARAQLANAVRTTTTVASSAQDHLVQNGVPSMMITLGMRDEEPSAQSPLTYRERSYYWPPPAPPDEVEGALRAELLLLQQSLSGKARGQYVNLAVFDHAFSERPLRAPIATLQWKDWRGEPVFAWIAEPGSPPWQPVPSGKPVTSSYAPGVLAVAEKQEPAPVADTQPARRPTPVPARPQAQRESTGEQDLRLAVAFEAVQDLYFLQTPADGFDFAVKLLSELIPCEAVSGCIYDINTDELRFVAVTGPGGEARRAAAIAASNVGLFAAAAHSGRDSLVVSDVTQDARYAPPIDGRDGLSAHNMAFFPLHRADQLFGMLQLINRNKDRGFSEGDLAVGTYIANQVTAFLRERRGLGNAHH